MLRLAARQMPRAMCAVAETPDIVSELKADIASIKAQLAAPEVAKGYSPEEFKAALEGDGAIDMAMVSDALEGLEEPARKVAMMEIGKVAGYKKDIAAAMPEIDWAAAAADVGDADLIAQLKMVHEKTLAGALEQADKDRIEVDAALSKVEAGFTATYAAVDKHEAELAEMSTAKLAELEDILWKAEGIKDMTIAELLDRDPEMRKEIEEEIANNVWAP